jgi:chorismate mutase
MKEKDQFFIVDKSVLPEVFLKVIEVKTILEKGKVKTVQEAVSKVGISRSAFYKYRDYIFPFYENTRGKTITMYLQLEDISGLLSNVLNLIADAGANILTINQNIPLNGMANVTITIETGKMKEDMGSLMETLETLDSVKKIEIIARE